MFYCVPFLPVGKEGIGVLSVELEGFSNIRPTHRARREAFVFGVMPLKKKRKKQQNQAGTQQQNWYHHRHNRKTKLLRLKSW